jgi:hypothetical protein
MKKETEDLVCMGYHAASVGKKWRRFGAAMFLRNVCKLSCFIHGKNRDFKHNPVRTFKRRKLKYF